MRKSILFSCIAAVSMLGANAAVFQEPALAQSEKAASVDPGSSCTLFNADKNLVTGTANKHTVITNGATDTTLLKCTMHGVANNTGRAVQFSGFLCRGAGGFTRDSRETISAGGVATLSCMTRND